MDYYIKLPYPHILQIKVILYELYKFFFEAFLVRIKFFQENPDSYFIKVKEYEDWELWLGP